MVVSCPLYPCYLVERWADLLISGFWSFLRRFLLIGREMTNVVNTPPGLNRQTHYCLKLDVEKSFAGG